MATTLGSSFSLWVSPMPNVLKIVIKYMLSKSTDSKQTDYLKSSVFHPACVVFYAKIILIYGHCSLWRHRVAFLLLQFLLSKAFSFHMYLPSIQYILSPRPSILDRQEQPVKYIICIHCLQVNYIKKEKPYLSYFKENYSERQFPIFRQLSRSDAFGFFALLS